MNEYDALLGRSKIRRDLLRRLIDDPDRRLHLRELARGAGTSAGTAARELARLEAAGLLTREAEGNQVYFQANQRSPLYQPVRDLVRRTIGAAEVLRRHLAGLAAVESAVIFGSYATGTMQPTSDIDLLVIGTPDRDALTDRLERASRELGRPVNEVVMTVEERAERNARGDGFMSSLETTPVIPVLP
jgi:predicted nucleotidyltransferase